VAGVGYRRDVVRTNSRLRRIYKSSPDACGKAGARWCGAPRVVRIDVVIVVPYRMHVSIYQTFPLAATLAQLWLQVAESPSLAQQTVTIGALEETQCRRSQKRAIKLILSFFVDN